MDNLTAKVSCFARAYHHNENRIHIFDDTAAQSLLGEEYNDIARSMTEGVGFFLPGFQGSAEEGLRLIVDRQLSPSVLGRSAFCERTLENELRHGCSQYIIFASGYDTFSIRNKNASLSVFELDLPEVLEDKQKRIESAGLESGAIYVPCSLANSGWTEKLLDSGFDPAKRAFGSLLGISYYLSKDEFKSLISSISAIMADGSAICFDYPSENESNATKTNKQLADGAGEKMKALYSFKELEALLNECGFSVCEQLDHKDMTEQYFADYNAHSPAHPMEAPQGVGYVMAVMSR